MVLTNDNFFLTIGYRVNMVKASACAVRRGSPEGKGQGAVERRRSTDPTDEHEAVPVADNKCSMKMLSRGLYLARKGTSWPLETSASQKNTTPDPRRTSTDSREGREAATTVRSQRFTQKHNPGPKTHKDKHRQTVEKQQRQSVKSQH